jgi:hypothetical protein
MITMKAGKVKEVFGLKAKEKRFKQEGRRCHRSEYRKPSKQAQLVKPVSKRTAEKNMKAVLRDLQFTANALPGEPVKDDRLHPPR